MAPRGPLRPADSSDADGFAPTEVASSGIRDAGEPHDDEEANGTAGAARARIGTTVGGYRLEAILGVGGTATVYRGEREDGQRAAIKMLHAWLNADARAKKRFLREAAVANRLQHPAIVRMLSEGEDESGTAYLVMELAEGRTLEALRVARAGRLEADEVTRIADELLAVLAVAHAQGVVHRDIKPANLLLTPEGELRVLDFGIARVMELSENPSLVTRSGAVLGTIFFMAPEQALGVRDDIDARADVWAVGATMFTLLCGQFVHRARTVNEALVQAATQPAPPIEKQCPNLPPAVAAVINRALSFDRHHRYADAGAMRAALQRATAGQLEVRALAMGDTLPEDATLPERSAPEDSSSRKPAERSRTPVIVAIGAVVAALVLGLFLVQGVWSKPRPTEPVPVMPRIITQKEKEIPSAADAAPTVILSSAAPVASVNGGAASALTAVPEPKGVARPRRDPATDAGTGSARATGAPPAAGPPKLNTISSVPVAPPPTPASTAPPAPTHEPLE